ncbi:copper ABC transporter ATP-binding protein [Halobellus salinus]|uniref:Copper ABC transporter ATP-binding protein n=1 Tax=Halobellus salinus TaxID=931585 RepID=A0A830EPY9_9EURY|nr:ABC transporter ATP-binding protein [Halobellus salinus]GGJ12397.1 copper ABC transporter ATP-binding protein [Halobellus salinus]SMP29026.1 ABC-2 type transport system ATP-binding protein [Halobellus salinus]
MAAIELDGVTKRFEDVTAVSDLSLTVEEGEVFGFLGPNGAGKSTTINLLLDFVRPTSGAVTVLGHDARAESIAVRERTGVLPEGFDVYDRLTGRAHVEFAVDSKEVDVDSDAVLERVGLADAADRKAGGYSKGMRQRLALAMALVGDPDLLILDEPSSGLDPAGAKEMREIVVSEADRGTTVFFSSHILEQVEAVCDRVGILRGGELVAVDSIDGLRSASDADATLHITVGAAVGDGLLAELRELTGVSSVDRDGDDALRVGCDSDAKTAVVTTLEDDGIPVDDFSTQEASLEDLFLAYTEDDAAVADSPNNGGAGAKVDDDHPETGDPTGNSEVSR